MKTGKLRFTPLEKAADTARGCEAFLQDGGRKPPALGGKFYTLTEFTILAILIVICSGPAVVDAADGLFVESGPGIIQSLHTEAVLLRYQREAPPLFKHESFYEGVFMHWNGKNHADAAGLAGGIRWAVKGDTYFSTALGGCRISRETENLGTPFEFYIRLGVGIRTSHYDVSLALVHISNGKLFFGWNGPNKSENFVTFSVGGLF